MNARYAREVGLGYAPVHVSPSIIWFRLDLRLADNPALQAAIKRGGAARSSFTRRRGSTVGGGASRWWLHQSLHALEADLRAAIELVIRKGRRSTLRDLVRTAAGAVFWNRRYEPPSSRVMRPQRSVARQNLEVEASTAHCSTNRGQSRIKAASRSRSSRRFGGIASPSPSRRAAAAPRRSPRQQWPESLALEALGLEPGIGWAEGLRPRGSRARPELMRDSKASSVAPF